MSGHSLNSSDNDLLKAATSGDGDALEELLARHGGVVRSRLEGSIDSRWRSVLSEDDVMQETYLDAFIGIRNFEPRGVESFVAWLTTMARRNLIDAVRELQSAKKGGGRIQLASQPNVETSYDDLFARLGASITSPSYAAARDEVKSAIEVALTELPAHYREVLARFDLAGESAEEVATACGCRVGTMHMRRVRGMRLLQAALRSRSYLLDGK